MVSWTTITVWTISVPLALGIGWSRYEKKKTRDKFVTELAAMDLTVEKNCSAACVQKLRWKSASSSYRVTD